MLNEWDQVSDHHSHGDDAEEYIQISWQDPFRQQVGNALTEGGLRCGRRLEKR